MRTLTIIGRRWFQRTYGNTYHTATAVVDGKQVLSTPKEYGYGDQYVETAFQALEAQGLIVARKEYPNGGHEAPWQWAERVGVMYSAVVSDVSRERDL